MSEDLDDIVDNLREPSAWIRILFMVGFALVLHLIVGPIIIVLMIVQALFKVISGETNFNLRRFGGALGQWVFEVIQFLTYNSQEKPFPFSNFPPMEDDAEEKDEGKKNKSKAAEKSAGSATKDIAKADAASDVEKDQGSKTAVSGARKKPAAKKSASKKKSGSKKTAAKKSSSKKSDSKNADSTDTADKAADDKAGDDKSEA